MNSFRESVTQHGNDRIDIREKWRQIVHTEYTHAFAKLCTSRIVLKSVSENMVHYATDPYRIKRSNPGRRIGTMPLNNTTTIPQPEYRPPQTRHKILSSPPSLLSHLTHSNLMFIAHIPYTLMNPPHYHQDSMNTTKDVVHTPLLTPRSPLPREPD